eukprot:7287330-Pyramimonas_sp.AAC.1
MGPAFNARLEVRLRYPANNLPSSAAIPRAVFLTLKMGAVGAARKQMAPSRAPKGELQRSRDFPPGNPAKDFGSERPKGPNSGKCGPLQSSSDRPYAICPAPGQPPSDILAQDCCRHTARGMRHTHTYFDSRCTRNRPLRYTFVPEKYYLFKGAGPPVPVVVVAPRIRQFEEASWK